MEKTYEIAKDILAVIGILAIAYHVYGYFAYHNYIKNNW